MEMKTLTVNGKTYIVADPDAAHFDNSKPGDGAWSGKNTVDRLCPAFTESGSVVTCSPVEGYPLSVVSQIQPVQEGEGDPRPAQWLELTGTNVAFNGSIESMCSNGEALIEGKTYRFVSNAKSSSGEIVPLATAEVWDNGGAYISPIPCVVKDNYVEFTMSADDVDGEETSGHVEIRLTYNGTVDESTVYIENELSGDITLLSGVFVFQEYDSGNIRPITGHSEVKLWRNDEQFTAQLGQTVYGGAYNWQTGALVIDRKRITLDGSEVWQRASTNIAGLSRYRLLKSSNPTLLDNIKMTAINNMATPHLMCSKLPTISADKGWMCNDGIYAEHPEAINVFCRQYATDMDAFQQMMTGAQIVFGLAEPITVQLTPKEILALSGENTLYSDTGDTQVSGKADLRVIIEKLTNAISALG